jgi:hypothetical protein
MRKIIRALFVLPFAAIVFLPSVFIWWLLGDTIEKAIWRQKDCYWNWLILRQ